MEEKRKAIALRYEQGKDRAPVVVAKGVGEVAERIIEIAKSHGVPVLEDKELTESLISVDVYEEIPPELYRAVAKVLVFIKSFRKSG